MSKSQNNRATGAAQNLGASSNAEMKPYIAGLQGSQSNIASSQQMPSFQSAFGGYNDALSTGGYNTADYGETLGGYKNMANTGGFTPASERAYMDQATSGVDNTYGVLKNQLNLSKTKTGGLGGSGEVGQLARQLSQAQGSAEQGAAVNLNQLENQNKLAGLQGSSNMEGAAATNRIVAAGGLAGMYNTATGEFTDQGKAVLAAMGINYQNQAAALQALTGLATSPTSGKTWYSQMLQGAAQGAASGAAAAGV